MLPSLPLWSALFEAALGGIGGDFLEAMEAAAAKARSRSSAKALSRGEMSIIGEDEVVLEAKGEVGLIKWSELDFEQFKAELNMACCSNMANCQQK